MELFNYKQGEMEPQKGDLLISEPFLRDPNFSRTVILLCEHNAEGSFGFVLNKPASVAIHQLLDKINRQDEVFIGGPVQQNMLQFIHCNNSLIEGGLEVKSGIYWGGNFEQMITCLENGLISSDEIRFFVGYSGWGVGQLDGEMALNSWIICRNAHVEQILDTNVDSLWKEILNTMGGKYRIISNFPVDPRLN
jgi:putative transcriptional regulator